MLEPNRVRISGETEADTVAVSLDIGPDAVSVDTRNSAISGERVTLQYNSLESVHMEREATYTVILETDGCEYALTNLSADRTAVSEFVEYTREQGGLVAATQPSGSTTEQTSTNVPAESEETESEEESQTGQEDETITELDEWSWGGASDPE